jgi:hypothetical protein
MNILKKTAFLGLTALLLTASGCQDDYFDINANPNQATSAPATLVLPTALNASGTYYTTLFPFLNLWMGYWNWSGNYSINQSDKNYQFTNGFNTGIWEVAYTRLKDYQYIEDQGVATNQPYLQAVAKIMKSLHFQTLVDTYGNVPYTNALQGFGGLQPKYDDQVAIYEDLIKQLDAALTLIRTGQGRVAAGEASLALGDNDIMFRGDMTKWARFANTLKLRVLLRQTEQPSRQAYLTTQIAVLKASTVGYLRAGENAAVNPGYTQSSDRQSPFYDTFGSGVNGSLTTQNNQYRGNKYALDFYTAGSDDRIAYFYNPAQTGGRFIGTFFGTIDVLPNSATSSIGPGLLQGPDQDAVIMGSHEAFFLQAEAAQRGWITGSAKTLYETGITESYKNLGVHGQENETAAELAAAYYGQAIANIGWDASPNKIQAIITQKWASLNGLSPFEAWADYRRLGIPAVPVSIDPSVTTRQIPVRLLYPLSEFNYNSTSVNAQGQINQFTSKPFWVK